MLEERRVEELMKDPRIRIGYVVCRMERRLEVGRCYRCWGLEHEAKDCRGEDKTGCCFACGERGHRRRECKGEERCCNCGKTGHRTGSEGCEVFRKALAKARKLERGSRRRSEAASRPREREGA
ncbi:uncharacterized protein [Euwallacea similis]|uniref:uncharacterized protein n=1 Tax=Euwallacea similis TaxID=1736056 RepID=UPI00344D964E